MRRTWVRLRRLIREAVAMAWAQRVPTIIAMVLMGGMTTAVLLTAGRASAAENQVLASIDAVGSRAITIRAEPSAGLDYSVVERLRTIEGVEWVGAFGQAIDVSNGGSGSDVAVASRALDAGGLKPNIWQRFERLGSAWEQARRTTRAYLPATSEPELGIVRTPSRRTRTPLTQSEVDSIRTARERGESVVSIAKRFEVHRATVWEHTRQLGATSSAGSG